MLRKTNGVTGEVTIVPSLETQRVRSVEEVVKDNDDIERHLYPTDTLKQVLTQDRQHILEVLNQSLVEKQFDPETTVKELVDPDGVNGHNYAVKQLKALLQETLGEGKEINSIFKEQYMPPGDNDHPHAHDTYEARLETLKSLGYTDEEIQAYIDLQYNN